MTAMSGISSSDRKNWNTPVVFDPNNPQVLYYGANRLYKSANRAVSWQVISPDLTNGGGGMNVVWGTITSISVAASNSQYVYIGTDDGNVWRTSNGGANWTWLSESLPDRWVTRVAADPLNHNTVYVTFSGYRYDSYLPHIFRSTNAGDSWNDITGNLPDMPVTDIRLHQPTRTLVAATYGRSMYAFNLDQLVNVKDQTVKNPGRLTIRRNPARDMLEFNFSPMDVMADYWVIDLQGRPLLHGKLYPGQDQYQVSLSGISKGSYLLIIGKKNSMVSEKFIKL